MHEGGYDNGYVQQAHQGDECVSLYYGKTITIPKGGVY